MEISNWLYQTCARDIMNRDVVTLAPGDTLEHAAAVFLREQISGAPVVDAEDKCVGVLSLADLAGAEGRALKDLQQVASSAFFRSNLTLPRSVIETELDKVRDKLIPVAEQPVSRFMTADIVSVGGGTTVHQIMHDMMEAHVHRVVVVGENRRLEGIVSTIDVFAAILRAAE